MSKVLNYWFDLYFKIPLLNFKKSPIYRPRTYFFGSLGCLRGLTKIGKTITPTVKRHIGATTINIDSKDMERLLIY